VGGSRKIIRGVGDGTYEVGMVGARFEEGRVRYERYTQDELVLAVPPSHPWAARGVVRLPDVIGNPSSCARRAPARERRWRRRSQRTP